MLMSLFKKKKKKEWKELEKVRNMSDAEIMECYKRLYVKSAFISGFGIFLFFVGILLIIFLF